MTGLLDKPALSKNDGSRLASKKNDGNGKVDEFGDNGVEHTKKSEKLKGQNLAKSQKSSKSGKSKGEKTKKLSKSENLPNFDAIKAGPIFLIPSTMEAINRL